MWTRRLSVDSIAHRLQSRLIQSSQIMFCKTRIIFRTRSKGSERYKVVNNLLSKLAIHY